jgi:hypothetical protein
MMIAVIRKLGMGPPPPFWQHVPSDAAFEEAPAAIAARHSVVLPRRLVPTHTTQGVVLAGGFHPAIAIVFYYIPWRY